MQPGDIVRSLRGHDKQHLFFVVKAIPGYVELANGAQRRFETPKHKREKHVAYVAAGEGRAAEKLRQGEPVTNRELRRALSDYRASTGETNAEEG